MASIKLHQGATIAIAGGGPGGAFTAIHLLRAAQERHINLRVVILERRLRYRDADCDYSQIAYSGCPKCAGGISPRLNDELELLGLQISEDLVQSSIQSITVQGNWKHIILPVPKDRTMVSVYRGVLPRRRDLKPASFDSRLLDHAASLGAELVPGELQDVEYDADRRPLIRYQSNGELKALSADFLVFALGLKDDLNSSGASAASDLFRKLQTNYRPPTLRKSLVFELETGEWYSNEKGGELHFVESTTAGLNLEMCSIIPKRGFTTVTLIGKSVDNAQSHQENNLLIRAFLALPSIRRTLPNLPHYRVRCVCNPCIVAGTARIPYGHRVAAVGDMLSSRKYKDGILSAAITARRLVEVMFDRGIDNQSLALGYQPTVDDFRRDNRYASFIFFLYRWFFTSGLMSRVLYQTYATELRTRKRSDRDFQRIFWDISSGDSSYRDIARSMLSPKVLWRIACGGFYICARNLFYEALFGLRWGTLGRYPTAVQMEEMEEKRIHLSGDHRYEFQCLYTVHLRGSPAAAFAVLRSFGEPERQFLNPRWVSIRRVGGEPLKPGSVIRYYILGGLIRFSIEQVESSVSDQVRFRVRNGFADGGYFIFEARSDNRGGCYFSVFLGFDYKRGDNLLSRLYWRTFRALFPECIHDILWNLALCEFKELVEKVNLESEAQFIDGAGL